MILHSHRSKDETIISVKTECLVRTLEVTINIIYDNIWTDTVRKRGIHQI
jgi:hypothetical protein